MTREEFIDGYLTRSECGQYRTPFGYQIEELKSWALPCACGDETCEGWAMIGESGVKWHVFHGAPDDEGKPRLHEFFKDDPRDQVKVSDDEAALIEAWITTRQ